MQVCVPLVSYMYQALVGCAPAIKMDISLAGLYPVKLLASKSTDTKD